jgi:all-trans-retinol dehydrogenase (NAD+)
MENLTAIITSHPAFEATTRYAAVTLDALKILPKGSFALVSLALAWYLNRWANDSALNNNAPAKFDWNKEIVVVTGGAGGIGAEVVKSLAARDITVIVLDVLPLTYTKG